MKYRLAIFLCACALAVQAQMEMNVDQLAAFIRSELALKQHTDKQVAAYLKKIHLNEKLTDKTITDLEAQGAGPKTVQALQELKDESAKLRPPTHDATYSPETAGQPQAQPSAGIRVPTYTPIPPPNSVRQAAILDEIKKYANTYTQHLPNFVCVQVTRRYVDPRSTGDFHSVGTVLTKVSYNEGHEDYKVYLVNNKYVDTTMDKLGGATSQGEFGSMLRNTFDQQYDVEYNWDHWGTLRGKRMAVFSYRTGRPNYDVELDRDQHAIFPTEGLIYADEYTGAIYRLTANTYNVQPPFPAVKIILDYDDVTIEGRPYICPLRAELHADDKQNKWKIDIEFRNYRRFGTEANITYGKIEDAPAPLAADQTEEQPAAPQQKPAQPAAPAKEDPWSLPTPPPPPPQ